MSSPPEMTRVLIVDDEPESRTRLRALLQAHGHVVSEATNGLEALEHARQQPPDLVISDILMPQMDGFALCRASRTDPALARTPFVFYTGTYATAKDVARARRLGATRFLVKSMAAEEVIRAITETLRQPETPVPGGVEPEPDETEIVAPLRRVAHQRARAPQPRTRRRGAGPPLAHARARATGRRIVSLTDTRGRITFVNRRFEEVTGFTRDMVRGQTHAILRTRNAEAGLGFEIRAALLAGKEWRGEFEQRRKDGTAFWERAVIAPVFDEAGAVTHFLRMSEDVTDQKQAQQATQAVDSQRRQSERDRIGRSARRRGRARLQQPADGR